MSLISDALSLGHAAFQVAYGGPISQTDYLQLQALAQLSNTFPRTFQPEVYGAVGDGVTNDRDAINSAINACYAAGGGVVQLGPKNYRVNPDAGGLAIRMRTGVILRGTSMASTKISTDNSLSAVPYCLIHPYNYHTITTPMTAEDVEVEQLTLEGTGISGGNYGNLHDLIAFCHVTKGRARRVGFNRSGNHFAEFNYCSNVLLEDCATVNEGDHGSASFQLDCGGSCGQAAQPRFTATITGAATYTSGSQTLLTVNSTANLVQGKYIVITGANGASAATYNALGGYKITSIVSATTVAISLAWPGNSTTAGTLTVQAEVSDVRINRYVDKINTDGSVNLGRQFLDLSHTVQTGTYTRITLENSFLVGYNYTVAPGGVKSFIGFDSGAYPLEFSDFKVLNNTFKGGGQSGVTVILNLELAYSSTYPLRILKGVEISGNVVEDFGMYNFLRCGDVSSDTTVRTSIASTAFQTTQDIVVRNNTVNVQLKGGAASVARPSRIFCFGSMEKAIVENNRLIFPNSTPTNMFGFSWTTAVTSNYGFLFDHVRLLTVRNNLIRMELMESNTAVYLFGFAFGCSAFELAGSLTPASQIWENNFVQGVGSIGTNIVRGFQELLTSGTTGISSWASPSNPSVVGRWSGNRFTSGGTPTTDGWSTQAANYNTPLNNGVLTTADTDVTEAGTWGRHDWWDGIDVVQNMNNAATTVDPLTTVLLQTGTMSASRVLTLPPATLGRELRIADQNGSVTGVNTIVVTRAGTDTISGATTLTLNAAYASCELQPNKGSTWTRVQ